jgi:phospholipid/cholesterol/gamma-HCH transport system ATP-binding protein
MITVSKITKAFNSRVVLKGVSFDLDAGEVVGLIGPSGGGKSVLLKIMANVVEPDLGEIIYDEIKGSQLKVGFLFQEGALFDSRTVLENVAFPLMVEKDTAYSGEAAFERSTDRDKAYELAYEILCDVGLRDAWKKYPAQISGGMRRRVGIARALVTKPELVLLDDPTGGLDPVAASVIMGLIRDLHQKYSPTIVLSSHDIRRLMPRVSRLLSLFEGELLSDTAVGNVVEQAPSRVVEFLKTRYDFSGLR